MGGERLLNLDFRGGDTLRRRGFDSTAWSIGESDTFLVGDAGRGTLRIEGDLDAFRLRGDLSLALCLGIRSSRLGGGDNDFWYLGLYLRGDGESIGACLSRLRDLEYSLVRRGEREALC